MLATRLPLGHATAADIDALPPNIVGEIVRGVLHTKARPATRHAPRLLLMTRSAILVLQLEIVDAAIHANA